MNNRKKEATQAQLDAEKAVLKQLEAQYKKALDDINERIKVLQADELTASRIYRIEHQKALKGQVEAILDKLHADEYGTISQFLSQTYTDAFVYTAYDLFGQGVPLILAIDPKDAVRAIQTDSKIREDLYTALGVDTTKLKQSISAEISRGLASGMPYSDIARNISNATRAPLNRANTIVATEAHRIQEAAAHDVHKKAKSKGADIVRQWNSTLDGRTRDAHRRMDGQIVEVDEPFDMGGQKAMYPGNFGDPAQDCNCRCTVLQRARWALGADELKTLQQRAEFFDLGEVKNLEEFSRKYIKAVENVENSDIIKEKISELTGIPLDRINLDGLPKEAQEIILKSFEDVYGRYPQLKGHTNAIRFDPSINATAQSKSLVGEVIIGPDFLDIEKLAKDHAYSVKLGFHPKGTENLNSLIVHELGHQLDGLLTKKGAYGGAVSEYGVIRTSRKVRKEVLTRLGLTDERLREIRREYAAQGYAGKDLNHAVSFERREFIANEVSDYANENEREFFAECFAEYMTSAKPRTAALLFGEVLTSVMEGL